MTIEGLAENVRSGNADTVLRNLKCGSLLERSIIGEEFLKLRLDHPDVTDTERPIFGKLLKGILQAIVGRRDFDSYERWTGREFGRLPFEDRNIGNSDNVTGDPKAHLGGSE